MAAAKMKQRAKPTAQLSDDELRRLSDRELRKRLRAEGKEFDELLAQGDPGAGLAPKKAEPLREAFIGELEARRAQLDRLEGTLRPDPREVENRAVAERIADWARRAAARESHAPADDEFIRGLHRGLMKEEIKRETRRKVDAISELRKNPPEPRAASIAAAVLSDPELWDLLHQRLREGVEVVGDFGKRYEMRTADRILDLGDVSTLFVFLHLLGEHGQVKVGDIGAAGHLPDPTLPPIENLRPRLAHLRANGFLAVRVEDGTAYVGYGERVREIAAKWAIELPEAEPGKVETAASTV